MIKILHLIYDHIKNPWVGGGAAIRCYEIYKRLSRKAYNIKVICGNYPSASEYTINNNFLYQFIGSTKNYPMSVFSYAIATAKLIKKYYKEYDIIIEDFAPWNPIFTYRLQNNIPVVLQLHQKEEINIFKRYFIFGTPFYFIEKFYPKKFRNIIVISKTFKKKFGVQSKIIPNGIEESYFNQKVYTNGEYCLFMGRIDFYHKGLDILIEAIKKSNFPLYIMGKGKNLQKLSNLAKQNKNIKYLGFTEGKDKINIIKKSRFLILPSRYEGQPLTIIEAAAIGKPVIVSDIPELKYVVDNNFGISFKCGDAEDLKKKIEYLWDNKHLIEKLGKKGREYAKHFTWDKIANEYEKYLMSLLYNNSNL